MKGLECEANHLTPSALTMSLVIFVAWWLGSLVQYSFYFKFSDIVKSQTEQKYTTDNNSNIPLLGHLTCSGSIFHSQDVL
jgi:hypothetical protein